MSKSSALKEKSTEKNCSSAAHCQEVDPELNSNLRLYEKLVIRNAELDRELLKFTGEKESDLKTVMDYLHRYNDVKDATQIILGSLANLEGTTVGELHERYGLTSNDSKTMSCVDDNLLSMETLDCTSPELWPEPIPGVVDFALINTSASNSAKKPWMADFNNEDNHLLHYYCRIPLTEVITEVRRILDLAYDLGLGEAKEMTREKYLNILQRRNCH